MEEALILTSGKDAAGMGIIDLRTGSALCSNFKNCLAEAGAVCTIGSSTSSYSGYGSAGDYIAVAQSKKPSINIYQWGKPQVHFQCHIQEIVTAIATDPMGAFLIAGTMKGWIYCWELSSGELINTFQAHFKAITRISVTKIGAPYCISVSEDGTGRAWELHKILDSAETYKNFGKHSLTPFRSWSAHTLPIKDMVVLDSVTTLRVLTCSLDRTIVLYDVLQAQICLRVSLPQALESLSINSTQDLVCAGSSSGAVFLVDLTSTAIAVTAAHAHATHHSTSLESRSGHSEGLPKHTSILEGHTKAVSSLNFSRDNCTLVSASQDGSVRVWNVWTRQCLREYVPLAKHGISNAILIPVPETLSIGVTRPTFCPVAHLHKYFKGQQSVGAAAGTATSNPSNAANGASASGGAAVAVVANNDASSSSLVLGPAFLGRRDADLSACRVKEVTVVATGPVSKSPFKARQTPAVVTSATTEESESNEDLGNLSFGADSEEMQTDETEGQLVQEDEDFVSFSGSFEVPKKSKIGSKKRKSLQAAEAAALEVEAQAEEVVTHAAETTAVEDEVVAEEVVVEEAAVEVEVVSKGTKKVKTVTKVVKTVKATASAEAEAERVEKVVKKVPASKKKIADAADNAVLTADAFFSPPGKKTKTKTTTTTVEETVTTETDATSEDDADRPAKKSVKFSANNEVKLITPHKLPGFTNGIQDTSSSEKAKSGPKVAKKAAGKKK